MPASPGGFTLLEVLVALLVLTVGLLGLAGTLEPTAALAREGKAHGRAALILGSRLDSLRVEVRGGAPACTVPAGGTLRHPGGITERWSAAARGEMVGVSVIAEFADRRGFHADTVLSVLACR